MSAFKISKNTTVTRISKKSATVVVDNTIIKLCDGQILNPFYVGVDEGSVLKMVPSVLYKNYKHVYVMCLKHNPENLDITDIYSLIVDKDKLKEICNMFTLVKAPIDILRTFSLKRKSNLIDDTLLELFFPADKYGIKYELNEIIVPMYELDVGNANAYISMFRKDTSIDDIKKLLELSEYYNKSHNIIQMDESIVHSIDSFDQDMYWKNPQNCKVNLNGLFETRALTYNGFRMDKINYNTLDKSSEELLTKLRTKTNNYNLNDETKTQDNYKPDGIYLALKESGNRPFYPTITDELCSGKNYTKEQIADLIDSIVDEKYKLHMLVSFITSKDYCHLVLNNLRVLKSCRDIFEKYKVMFAYFVGYAWITFYLEESYYGTRTDKHHRYVYDIDTASKLPVFPFSMENVHNNPYATLLLNRNVVDPKTNAMSIDVLEEYEKYYGICTRDEALKRFNIFISGNSTRNIFETLDPEVFSFSGSMITGCLQKRSPLLDLCTDDEMNIDDTYNTFFAHYYKESDIDAMCRTDSIAGFLKHTTTFIETVCKNVDIKRTDINIVPTKKMAVIISKHFFTEAIDDLNSELSTDYTSEQLIEMFKQGLTVDNDSYENTNNLPPNISNYFYADYVQEKRERNKLWNKLEQKYGAFDEELVASFNKISSSDEMHVRMYEYDITETSMRKKDSEISYFVNDFRDDKNKVPKDKNFMVFKFNESIKFKISSPLLRRTIEIFKIDTKDPFNTVARFHKPCVRAYMQGNTFYMLPSFITAMMTSINIDYKYFAASRNPVNIINKYIARGYSFIANDTEKKAILSYNQNIKDMNGMFSVETAQEQFGTKTLDNKIYRPGVYMAGLPETFYKKSTHKYIQNIECLKEVYKKHYVKYNIIYDDLPIDMLKYTSINPIGCIEPVKKWLIQAFYECVIKDKN